MKKILGFALGITMIFLTPAVGNAAEAISIEQFFDDGKDRSGNVVYVNGPVGDLTIDEDPFSDKKEISGFTIKKGTRIISIILKKNLPSGIIKLGDQVTVKFKSGPMLNTFTMAKGEIIKEGVEVSKWSSKSKPKMKNLITAEEYFKKKLRVGKKRITFEGKVYRFVKAIGGDVRIDLVSDGNMANVFISPRYWKKKEIRDVLKTLKEWREDPGNWG